MTTYATTTFYVYGASGDELRSLVAEMGEATRVWLDKGREASDAGEDAEPYENDAWVSWMFTADELAEFDEEAWRVEDSVIRLKDAHSARQTSFVFHNATRSDEEHHLSAELVLEFTQDSDCVDWDFLYAVEAKFEERGFSSHFNTDGGAW